MTSLVAVPVESFRLSSEQLKHLELRLGGAAATFVGNTSDPGKMGFALGVQHVLNLLRNGYKAE